MSDATVTYLFDPLCGWCYGATPMLDRLAASGIDLTLLPTGLFSGAGARPLDAGFAAHAWSNDQRIARLSGQRSPRPISTRSSTCVARCSILPPPPLASSRPAFTIHAGGWRR